MNSKRYQIIVFYISAILVGIIIGNNYRNGSLFEFSEHIGISKIKKLISYIENDYISSVNTDSIVDIAVNDIMKTLDPHSIYISKEQQASSQERSMGYFTGIGIQFINYKDTITVTNVLDDSPAKKSGIQTRDRILMVNNDTLFNKDDDATEQIIKTLKKSKTPISLKVKRRNVDFPIDILVNRREIILKSIPTYYMINDTLGYIKLKRFSGKTIQEFTRAMTALNKKGMTALALDLRDNPGGYLETAIGISDQFLPEGKTIVSISSKQDKEVFLSTSEGLFINKSVYVFINEKSASASEVVAGALQDNDISTIIGRRSFGKGLIQQEMPLPDGSVVRLTTGKYYTPTGRSIQRNYTNREKYKDVVSSRTKSGEMQSKDSIKVDSTLIFKTPKGKTLYGGGGIIPDIYIPIKEDNNLAILNILQSFFLSQYVFKILDENKLNFDKSSILTQPLGSDLVEKLSQIISSIFGLDATENRGIIEKYMRAEIAKQLFGEIYYYRTLEPYDEFLKQITHPLVD